MSDNEDSNHAVGGNTLSYEEVQEREEDALGLRQVKRARVETARAIARSRPVVKSDHGDLLIMGWTSGSFFSFAAPRSNQHVRVIEDIMHGLMKITEAAERKKSISMFLNAMMERIVIAKPSSNACIFAVGACAYSTLGLILDNELGLWRTDAHKENDGNHQYVVYTFPDP